MFHIGTYMNKGSGKVRYACNYILSHISQWILDSDYRQCHIPDTVFLYTIPHVLSLPPCIVPHPNSKRRSAALTSLNLAKSYSHLQDSPSFNWSYWHIYSHIRFQSFYIHSSLSGCNWHLKQGPEIFTAPIHGSGVEKWVGVPPHST